MAKKKTKRRTINPPTINPPTINPPTINPQTINLQTIKSHQPEGIAFQIVIFVAAFVILFSRRPDALLNPQFYAEEGALFYPAAYQYGLHSLLLPYGGYLHTLIRLVALASQLGPLLRAPLLMNLFAIAVQILPVNVFLSSRFSQIPFPTRLLGSFLYLAVPNSWEIHANLTNVQWHLVLLACLLLLARPERHTGWRIFDVTVLVLTSCSSPIAILLVPVAAVLWWKRRQGWAALSLGLLVPGALLEGLLALLSHTRQLAPNGATFDRLIRILGGQVFFSGLFGMTAQSWFVPRGLFLIGAIATVVGVAVLGYALRYAPIELKVFIVFSFAALVLGLARPLAGPPNLPQWEYLCVPGRGNRYYFLPMLGFLASLLWLATRTASPPKLRYCAIGLLLLLPIGIFQDWHYPPFTDFDFPRYAAQFEQAAPGTRITIPINPGMTMEITKR